MLATGYQGPFLLEDAVDLVGMMVSLGKVVPPTAWIDEYRLEAEATAMRQFAGI